MNENKKNTAIAMSLCPAGDGLFNRVASILEQARNNVVRSVNSNMVLAYWLIGREIVQAVLGGGRAEYGQRVIKTLSTQLTSRYGKGFSLPNLKNFRQFYSTYPNRLAIGYPSGSQLPHKDKLVSPMKKESPVSAGIPNSPEGVWGGASFAPNLTWSHYRALMRVEDEKARLFYEREAAECGWNKTQLERQIYSFYYQRILANHGEAGLKTPARRQLAGMPDMPGNILKSPLVLEFLGLPDSPSLHENDLEQAIIDNLQSFLLELGKGFSFVARQKHIRIDDDDFYIDLVFYNYIIKCFLLVDLKIGRLTLRDIGQTDGYVRMFDDQFRVPGDNPTIGLVLCSDKGEAVAKYSVLKENRRIFATKYLPFLPSEHELKLEIEKECRLLEGGFSEIDSAILLHREKAKTIRKPRVFKETKP
jgi:predicted nuclease of restriction endonuclease-like (RecB) superfamily